MAGCSWPTEGESLHWRCHQRQPEPVRTPPQRTPDLFRPRPAHTTDRPEPGKQHR